MKQKFAKLIDVKSIVTILLTAVFCVLALRRTISAEQFITVFTVVISFYFGTQYQKNYKNNKEDNFNEKDYSSNVNRSIICGNIYRLRKC